MYPKKPLKKSVRMLWRSQTCYTTMLRNVPMPRLSYWHETATSMELSRVCNPSKTASTNIIITLGCYSMTSHLRIRSKSADGFTIVNAVISDAALIRRVSIITRAPISFGLIPKEHWVQPDWIDEDRARLGRQKMMAQRIIYAGELAVALDCYLYSSSPQAAYRMRSFRSLTSLTYEQLQLSQHVSFQLWGEYLRCSYSANMISDVYTVLLPS